MTQSTDRDRHLRHAADAWTDTFTDWQKITAGVAVLAKHRPATSDEALVNASMEVLRDESRWTEIHPGWTQIHSDATFAAVRSATLRAEADRDATSAAVFFTLENLLRTAYNAAWRPGMFPPFDANVRDAIFPCLRHLSDLLDGGADTDLIFPERLMGPEARW